jgi:hypothetical protein
MKSRPVPPYQPGDLYLVTGRTRNGEPLTRTFATWPEADEFSLFICQKFLLRDGRRTLLRSTSPINHIKRSPFEQE